MKIGAVGYVQLVSLCDCKVDLHSIKPTDDSLSSCSTSICLQRDLPQQLIFWDRVGIVLDDYTDWNGTSVEACFTGCLGSTSASGTVSPVGRLEIRAATCMHKPGLSLCQ